MSNVLVRNRGTAETQFEATAKEIRNEVTKLCMDEKIYPSRYRFILSVPTIDIARSIVINIKKANSIYATNKHELQVRTDYQNAAICDCATLLNELEHAYLLRHFDNDQSAVGVKRSNRFMSIAQMIITEQELIKRWRNSDKKRFTFDD